MKHKKLFSYHNIDCLEHKGVKWHFEEFEIFAYYETFGHSLVGTPICLCQHYFLIVKIAFEFEIPHCLAQSF